MVTQGRCQLVRFLLHLSGNGVSILNEECQEILGSVKKLGVGINFNDTICLAHDLIYIFISCNVTERFLRFNISCR